MDDVLDSRISLVIGSFKFALWRMDGVWLVVKRLLASGHWRLFLPADQEPLFERQRRKWKLCFDRLPRL
jgi:hypothetical protein